MPADSADTGDSAFGVLIADDTPDVRLVLRLQCELVPGCHVVGEAEDRDSAVALARETAPDLVLLDLSMPGGGLEAIPEIKQSAPDATIVVLSGHADWEMGDKVRAHGAQYVEKSPSLDVPGLVRSVMARP